MIVNLWWKGRLAKTHKCSDKLTEDEVLDRFGISRRWRVSTFPDGRPDLETVIQEGKDI